jgi:spore coat protein U-like protein
MQNAGNDRLHYNIYNSALHTTIVGEGAGGYPAIVISGGILSLGNWSATATLYGLAPADPAQKTGAYSDTVTVRIDW